MGAAPTSRPLVLGFLVLVLGATGGCGGAADREALQLNEQLREEQRARVRERRAERAEERARKRDQRRQRDARKAAAKRRRERELATKAVPYGLVGTRLEEANRRLTTAGLSPVKPKAGGEVRDPLRFVVCGTRPSAGSEVDEGSTVELTIAEPGGCARARGSRAPGRSPGHSR